ncbi:MAG TPA: YciI family protein [Stellaceae bacterium]|nr:YciI family protein [Stellaceae bacterium]
MRFMMLMYPGPKAEAGVMPDDKLIAAMMAYNKELANAGVLLALDGLQPTAKGARIRFSGRKASVTEGPFPEAREVLGGYWMIQVNSKDEAVAWAKRCPAPDGEMIEIRQVFEAADFGPEVAREEGALLEQIGKRIDVNAKAARS